MVFTIFRKELLEALRDRRTLFMMIALPILLYPLLILGLSRLQEGQQAATAGADLAAWPCGASCRTKPRSLEKRRQGGIARLDWGAPESVRAALDDGPVAAAAQPATGARCIGRNRKAETDARHGDGPRPRRRFSTARPTPC